MTAHKTKVYGLNYDGRRRLIVRARSGAEARRFLGIEDQRGVLNLWRNYASETGNPLELELCANVGDCWVTPSAVARRREDYTRWDPITKQ